MIFHSLWSQVSLVENIKYEYSSCFLYFSLPLPCWKSVQKRATQPTIKTQRKKIFLSKLVLLGWGRGDGEGEIHVCGVHLFGNLTAHPRPGHKQCRLLGSQSRVHVTRAGLLPSVMDVAGRLTRFGPIRCPLPSFRIETEK